MTFSLTPASNSADWRSDIFEVVDDDTNEGIYLSGLSISVEIKNRFGHCVLSGTTQDGAVTINGSEFEFIFASSRMSQIPSDTYQVFARVLDPADGSIDQLIVSTVQIYEGGFK